MTWTIETTETVLQYPTAIMTLDIPNGVNGRKIIDAAQDSIEENKASNLEVALIGKKYYRDDDRYFVIGQSSRSPDEELILAVNAGRSFTHLILPEGDYTCVQVISYHWPGRQYLIGGDDTAIVKACQHFRNQLRDRLIPTQPGK